MIVVFHEAAQAEFDDAIAHYRAILVELGDAFLEEAVRAIRLIVEMPHACQPLGRGLRRCRLNRFPCSNSLNAYQFWFKQLGYGAGSPATNGQTLIGFNSCNLSVHLASSRVIG